MCKALASAGEGGKEGREKIEKGLVLFPALMLPDLGLFLCPAWLPPGVLAQSTCSPPVVICIEMATMGSSTWMFWSLESGTTWQGLEDVALLEGV